MGEGKESARAQVLASRALLDEELVRLEASARAAVDIKAKVKRNPVKAAGVAAGAGFLLVGGPKKVLRGARNRVFGKPAARCRRRCCPRTSTRRCASSAMTATRSAARSSATSRATWTRTRRSGEQPRHPRRGRRLLGTVGGPIAFRYGVKLADELFGTDQAGFADKLAKVRSQRAQLLQAPEAAPLTARAW